MVFLDCYVKLPEDDSEVLLLRTIKRVLPLAHQLRGLISLTDFWDLAPLRVPELGDWRCFDARCATPTLVVSSSLRCQ